MTDSTKRNLIIYCTKPDCKFEQLWDDITKEEAKKFYIKWNFENWHKMQCVHDYEIAERVK